jgi:hypothetical protein
MIRGLPLRPGSALELRIWRWTPRKRRGLPLLPRGSAGRPAARRGSFSCCWRRARSFIFSGKGFCLGWPETQSPLRPTRSSRKGSARQKILRDFLSRHDQRVWLRRAGRPRFRPARGLGRCRRTMVRNPSVWWCRRRRAVPSRSRATPPAPEWRGREQPAREVF